MHASTAFSWSRSGTYPSKYGTRGDGRAISSKAVNDAQCPTSEVAARIPDLSRLEAECLARDLAVWKGAPQEREIYVVRRETGKE